MIGEMTGASVRKADLAKIHIAKKDLHLDDDTYRYIIRTVGKAESGSSADLDVAGRARVLRHFKEKGWKPRSKKNGTNRPHRPRVAGSVVLATSGQVGKIRSFWIQLSDAGAVRDRSERGLRRWVQSATRRRHETGTGWSAPEYLPKWVAQNLIEQLKQWAARLDIRLRE